MVYVRPETFLTDDQKSTIYDAIHRAHVTASESTFILRHTTSELPMVKADGPYDIPGEAVQTVDYTCHAMVGMKKADRELTVIGEELDADLKLFAWLEELEGFELGTTSPELDQLTKDIVVFQDEEYEVLSVRPVMPFFGHHWMPGTAPSLAWDRNFLSAKFTLKRKGRE